MNGQTPCTREQFQEMTPFQQGYTCYMQGAWNENVPSECLYPKGTPEYQQWCDGEWRATLDIMEVDG